MNADAGGPLVLRVDVDRGEHAVRGHPAQQPEPAHPGAGADLDHRAGPDRRRRGSTAPPHPRADRVAPEPRGPLRAHRPARRPRRGSCREVADEVRAVSGRPSWSRRLLVGPRTGPCPTGRCARARHPLVHRYPAPFHRHLSGHSHRAGARRCGNTGTHDPAVDASRTTHRRRRDPLDDRKLRYCPIARRPGRCCPDEGADWTPPSWDEVVREHADRVYRLAYRLTGNPHDAEDLTQETFVRVFRSLAVLQARHLRGLAAPHHHEPLPRHGPPPRAAADGGPARGHRPPARAAGPSPSRSSPTPTSTRSLQAALDELAPEFRAAVVLCDVEGLSYEEIGATLGVKLGTVRSRIHRGRAALRASLERRGAAARGGRTTS